MTIRTRLALILGALSVGALVLGRLGLAAKLALPTIWELAALVLAGAAILVALGKEGLIAAVWNFLWRDRAHIEIRFGPEQKYTLPKRATEQRFRFGIYCDGPAEAKNTTLWLVAATPTKALTRSARLPFQVARDGAEWVTGFAPILIPLEPVSINPGDEELFEPLRCWVSSEGRIMVDRIDTKPGGNDYRWTIEAGEEWIMEYRASAANAKSANLKVRVYVSDGSVCVDKTAASPLDNQAGALADVAW